MQSSVWVYVYATLRQPLGAAIFASALCAYGVSRIGTVPNVFRPQKFKSNGGKRHKSESFDHVDTQRSRSRQTQYRNGIESKDLPTQDAGSKRVLRLNNWPAQNAGQRRSSKLNEMPVGISEYGKASERKSMNVSNFYLRRNLENPQIHGPSNNSHSFSNKRYFYVSSAAICVTVAVLLLTNSFAIALPFTCLSSVIVWIYLGNREVRDAKAILLVWPEVVDHLISGIQSGMSLSESMASLSLRGPEIIRKDFQDFKEELLETGNFHAAVEGLRAKFHSPASDQILEAILMAKMMGGSELLEIFRTLGNFLRQDLALRKEIEIKHGWIKNSAHLSSAAPWLLLLLLSSQPGTIESFSQPGGVLILLLGLAMTLVAYMWMGRLSKLPQPPRVFGLPANRLDSREITR